MRFLRLSPLLAVACLTWVSVEGAMPIAGREWPDERRVWVDPEFGREIVQWTTHAAPSWPLYFNIDGFIDDDRVLVFSERTGSRQLFVLDLTDGRLRPLTNHPDVHEQMWHWPALGMAWFVSAGVLHSVETTTGAVRTIGPVPAGFRSLSVTCDGKWALVAHNLSTEAGRFGPWTVSRMDTATGATEQIAPGFGFIVSHVQASPTDPSRATFNWQHRYRAGPQTGTVGDAPVRIWWLRVDGSDGGPVGPQEWGLHRTHDFWWPDGSRLGYAARYVWGENRGRQFLGSCAPDGSDNFMIELPVGPSHPMVHGGGRYWIADVWEREMILTLTTVENREAVRTEKLFRHDSSWQGQPSHPHPRVSHDGRWLVFGTDRTGVPQVYTIELNLGPG
jgi:oligogalacturonide lyase